MKSYKKNKMFADEVSRVSINAGVELTIAKNVVRWRAMNVKQPVKKDFKYGLSADKLMGPMARKIQFGTESKRPITWIREDFTYNDGKGCAEYAWLVREGTMVCHKGTLYTSNEWKDLNNVG